VKPGTRKKSHFRQPSSLSGYRQAIAQAMRHFAGEVPAKLIQMVAWTDYEGDEAATLDRLQVFIWEEEKVRLKNNLERECRPKVNLWTEYEHEVADAVQELLYEYGKSGKEGAALADRIANYLATFSSQPA
jgi:hypothetical protein